MLVINEEVIVEDTNADNAPTGGGVVDTNFTPTEAPILDSTKTASLNASKIRDEFGKQAIIKAWLEFCFGANSSRVTGQ